MSSQSSAAQSLPVDPLIIVQRLNTVEKDMQAHSETLTDHNSKLAELMTDKAVSGVEKKDMDERFDRLEKQISGIHKFGWAFAGAVGLSYVTMIVNFANSGGFRIG